MSGTGFRRTLPIDFRFPDLWCALVGVVGVGVCSGSVGEVVLSGVESGVNEGVEDEVWMVSLSVDRAGRVGLGRIGVEGSVLDTSDMMLVYNYQVIKEVKVSKIRVGDSHL